MPYRKRIWVPDCFYHVGSRGNRRDPLFQCDADFKVFFHILEQLHEKIPFEIASYCLMTNHYHLQIRTKEMSLSRVMSHINKRYANYYNTRYKLSGHVFEKRFWDKIITDDRGMLEVSRYIHLNPVNANMVEHPNLYPWSSYPLFHAPHLSLPNYMNIDPILDIYTGSTEQKKLKYCQSLRKTDVPLIFTALNN